MSDPQGAEALRQAPVKRLNRNRGIVLRLSDAAALHRWFELLVDGRKFDNPIVAAETERAAADAYERLGEKLIAVFSAYGESTDAD